MHVRIAVSNGDSNPPGPLSAADPDEEVPDFRLPVSAPVSSGFGLRSDPFSRKIRFHKGIDLAAPLGTEVRAAMGGKVAFAGYERGYGTTVVIQHGDTRTRYAHLGAVHVKNGDMVGETDAIGSVGSSGRSTGPHLHFEVTRVGEAIDPTAVLAD